MQTTLHPIPAGRVKLLPGLVQQRSAINRSYLLSLRSERLLQNYYLEAGLWTVPGKPEDCHWGWESPTCQLRGHFLGHWLSAAARLYANRADLEIKGKADGIVAELGRCQAQNGGEWAGSIPEKYFQWLAQGLPVWAPHYTVHKTLLGLYHMAALAGSQQALEIISGWARWFYRWSGRFSRDGMDEFLDVETGGMLELWADLYELTGESIYLELVQRYERRRFFNALLAGDDALTNQHANTQIPEIHGAARLWEVTGEARWRDVVEAFWRSAVTERAAFCTGGQTDGEIWTPPGELASRLSPKNQEHCTVYNLLRLAEYLYRWTGDPVYADYWERNLYNGLLAQQHPDTGMVAYFLPLKAGSRKMWSSPTETFSCCLGTLVQAQTQYENNIYYEDRQGLVLSQIISSQLEWSWEGVGVKVELKVTNPLTSPERPANLAFTLDLECERPVEFSLKVRAPWWLSGNPAVTVEGVPVDVAGPPSSMLHLRRVWDTQQNLGFQFPKSLSTCSLPDAPEMVAFMDGPLVLAGLFEEETALHGDRNNPESMLSPVHRVEWYQHHLDYRTRVAPHGTRFLPLYEVRDERYTVYFPISS